MAARIGLLLGLLLLIATACSGSSSRDVPEAAPRATNSAMLAAATEDPLAAEWATLRERPLVQPALRPGEACPVSPATTFSSAVASGRGPGPVYVVPSELLVLAQPSGDATDLLAGKVLFAIAPDTMDIILVRGRELATGAEARFGPGANPEVERRLGPRSEASSPGEERGLRTYPTTLRVPAPGCYGFQLDAPGFSYVVIVEVVAVAP